MSLNSGGITREAQDDFSFRSQQKCEAAIKAGKFKDEIVPVEVPQWDGSICCIFDTDEHPIRGHNKQKRLDGCKAGFQEGRYWLQLLNASGINDGAAAVVVMSSRQGRLSSVLKPLATDRFLRFSRR